MVIICLVYWIPKWLILDLMMERLYPKILFRQKEVTGNRIALTFDDMPYGSHEQIIQLLDKHNMKGTFFVISDYFNEQNRQIFVDAVKNGHQLGNHGKTNSMHALHSKDKLSHEIDSCDNLIRQIYNEANVELPQLMCYRPGCGLFNQMMLDLVGQNNYTLTLGSVYPNDPMMPSSIINYHYLVAHIEAGDIVILHDRSWTPPLLERLLIWLTSNGFHSVTVNDLN